MSETVAPLPCPLLLPLLADLSTAQKVSDTILFPLVGCLLLMGVLAILGRVPPSYNFKNLMSRWKTSAMTALAFTMVVALMTVMLAFVNGMVKLTEQSGRPGNVLVLSDGATDESFSNLGFVDTGDIARVEGVLRDERTGEPLASRETFLIVTQPLDPTPGEKGFEIKEGQGVPKARRRFLQVRGIEDPVMAGRVHALELLPGGSWFSEAGVVEVPTPSWAQTLAKEGEPPAKTTAIQAVLGSGIAAEMGNDRPEKVPLTVGDTFRIGERVWIVAGVMKSAGTTFDSEVWAKRGLVGPLYGKETFTSMVLATAGADAAERVAKSLKTEFKKANLDAQLETKYFARLSETSKQFAYAISFVAVFMAIGGVFGVMNTMFAAIAQRTKDIGVLRIVGFPRSQILVSFLLESMLLALVGGLIGCAVGLMADGWSAKSIVSSGQGGGGKFVVLRLDVNLEVLLTGMLMSLMMGLAGGFVPAINAMRVRPLESMR